MGTVVMHLHFLLPLSQHPPPSSFRFNCTLDRHGFSMNYLISIRIWRINTTDTSKAYFPGETRPLGHSPPPYHELLQLHYCSWHRRPTGFHLVYVEAGCGFKNKSLSSHHWQDRPVVPLLAASRSRSRRNASCGAPSHHSDHIDQ
jgi:hypothetical protein